MSSLLERLTNKRFKECPAKFSKLLILFAGCRELEHYPACNGQEEYRFYSRAKAVVGGKRM